VIARTSLLFAQFTLAVVFVALACAWSWAFLMQPYRAIPFPVRWLLTLLLFGSTACAAWRVMRKKVSRPAMVVGMAVSAVCAGICFASYTELGTQYVWPTPSNSPSGPGRRYELAYLLAPWAIALPWTGLLSVHTWTGWPRRVQLVTIGAVLVLAEIPFEFFLVFSGRRLPLGLLLGGLLLGLLITAFVAGVVAVIGSMTLWLLASGKDEQTAGATDIDAAGDASVQQRKPWHYTIGILIYRSALLMSGFVASIVAVLIIARLLLPLRGRYLSNSWGWYAYANDAVYYPIVICALLFATLAAILLARRASCVRWLLWLLIGIAAGLGVFTISTAWFYISYLG